MFSQKKGKAGIPKNEYQFGVRYVGKTRTYVANGYGCTRDPVQRIWDNSTEEKDMKKIVVCLNPSGILIKDFGGKKANDIQIDIKDISYCCAEKGAHERVFAWICKNTSSSRVLECHAVVCGTREEAQKMAVAMSQSFHMAYRDWKNDKEKQARLKTSSEIKEKTRESIRRSNSENDNINLGSSINGSFCSDPGPGLEHDPEDGIEESVFMSEAMKQMNIVEEDVISFTENNIVVEAVRNGQTSRQQD